MDSSFDRPGRTLIWAKETFGDIALDPKERTLRFIEEAIEVAHAMGLDDETILAVLKRCSERPQGSPAKEIAQAFLTLELLAKIKNLDLEAIGDAEFARVQAIPKEEFAKRHALKKQAGIAL